MTESGSQSRRDASRRKLLNSALVLVRERGVAGTAVQDVIAHAGLARQSAYNHFPGGKHELVVETTRYAGQGMTALIAHVAGLAEPTDGLTAMTMYWKGVITGSDYRQGCPIGAAARAGHEIPEAPVVAAEVFRDWHTIMVEQLRQRGASTEDAVAVATTAIAAYEGAVTMCIAQRSTEALDHITAALSQLISGVCTAQ